MEDDFYATLKFKNGEEVFAKVAPSEEEDRTMLLVHHPITICEIKARGGTIGYKVEPWLKTSNEDLFVLNMNDILTISESSDIEMITMHQTFINDTIRSKSNQSNIFGSENNTTNNRMELIAPIMALNKIKNKSEITVYTDSKYVRDGITDWIKKWKINNWKNSNKKPVKNKDLGLN